VTTAALTSDRQRKDRIFTKLIAIPLVTAGRDDESSVMDFDVAAAFDAAAARGDWLLVLLDSDEFLTPIPRACSNPTATSSSGIESSPSSS